jgi:hypothetical protein
MSTERKHGIEIGRRTFLRIGSGAVSGIALYDLINLANKEQQLTEEAKKEAMNLGKTPASKEVLDLTRQIESESGWYILRNRTPEEIRNAQAAKAQQKDFLDSAREIYNVHYADKEPSAIRFYGTFALAVAGLLWSIFGGRRSGEVSAQNEQR